MKKRTLSLLLAAALVVGLLTTGALAAGTTETLTEGYATISLTGVLSKESKTVVIDGESQEITIYKIQKSGSVLKIKWDSDSSFIDIEAGAWAYAPSADGTYGESDFLYNGFNGGTWELNYNEFASKFSPNSLICANAMMLNMYFQFDGASAETPTTPTDSPKPTASSTIISGDKYTIDFGSHAVTEEELTFRSYDYKQNLAVGENKTVKTIHMKPGETFTFITNSPAMINGVFLAQGPNEPGLTTASTISKDAVNYAPDMGELQQFTVPNPEDFRDNIAPGGDLSKYKVVVQYMLSSLEGEGPSDPLETFYVVLGDAVSAAPTATPSPCAATLDGKAINLNAYLFPEVGGNSSNYVMLRDVAYLLNGTKAQFEVKWDKNTGIAITTGQPYTAVGGELQSKGDGNKPYTANTSAITVNGKTVDLTAYAIGGNNYFKLRDLGAALGFNVSWDKSAGITIDSTKPYTGV